MIFDEANSPNGYLRRKERSKIWEAPERSGVKMESHEYKKRPPRLVCIWGKEQDKAWRPELKKTVII